MTKAISTPRFVVIRWIVLTLSCRQGRNFCQSMAQPWPWVKVMERSSSTFPHIYIFFILKYLRFTVLTWEAKVIAAADAAETNWKHKVTPDWGDLINHPCPRYLLLTKCVCTQSNKANLRDLIAATGLVILLKLDSNRQISSPCDLEIWWMTLKNNRASLQYYIKLCASIQIHRWIQTGVTVRKRPIWVNISDFLPCVTYKLDRWPWKSIGNLFYITLNFAYHFKAIGELKLELQSGNAQFGSKSAIFLSCVTLKFDGWPWKTVGHLFYATSSFVHHSKATG